MAGIRSEQSAGSGDVLPGGKNKSGNPNVGKAEGQRDKRGLAASAECCETAIVYDLSTVRSCDTERSRISRHCCAASRAKREQGSGLQDPRELQKEFGNLEGLCRGLQDPGVLQAGGQSGKKRSKTTEKKEQQNTRATWILRCGGQLH